MMFDGHYEFKRGSYGIADIPTIFQEKIDRTLAHCTPVWLDDIIVVTRGNKQDHERKSFDVLSKLEKAGYRASKKKSKLFMNRMKWQGRKIKPENTKLKSFLGAILKRKIQSVNWNYWRQYGDKRNSDFFCTQRKSTFVPIIKI